MPARMIMTLLLAAMSLLTLAAGTAAHADQVVGSLVRGRIDSGSAHIAAGHVGSPTGPESRSSELGAGSGLRGTVASGGVFRMQWGEPPTLDPHLVFDTVSAGVVVEVFGGLLALNPAIELVPDLAESWERSADGLVYTFHLRSNARFQNGKLVTAADFKWSFERAAHPATGSFTAPIYLGDIVGATEYMAGNATEIGGVRVIDELTLQITIDAPKVYFPLKLTFPAAYVLERETVEAGGPNWWVNNPIGTGPFKLAEHVPGDHILLERNADYYLEPARLDGVYMNLTGGEPVKMYENDDIDIAVLGLVDLDRVLNPTDPLNKELVVATPRFNVSFIGFNCAIPPFDDQKFRRALNHAVDKELIARDVLGGTVRPAYGILPPGFPAYNPDLQGLRYDTSTAIQLLSESAYADAATRPPILVTAPKIDLDLEVIVEMWRQVLGVDVETQQVAWATFLGQLQSKSLQVFGGLGWEADYPDPHTFLDIPFHSQGGGNHGACSNSEVDRLLEEARIEQDPVRRVALYRQAEELIVDDASWLPLWFPGQRYLLVKPYVKGYQPTPIIAPKLRYVYFAAKPVPGLSLWGLLGLTGGLACLLVWRMARPAMPFGRS